MKKYSILLTSLSLLTNLSFAQKTIEINNPIKENRTELISIPYSKFSSHFSVDTVFTIKDNNTGKTLAHQLEKLGENNPQNVLIEVSIPSKGKINLTVTKDKPSNLSAKTYARYIPERKDDFAWENDVIAFRMYGKALEGTSEDAQGIDFWAKRTNNLVINDWYKGNDYHKDHGQGLDYYSVGQTLGAGDIAIYYSNNIQFTKHYRSYKILDNGPLRTTFELTFEPEEIANHSISMTKIVSIDAGQQFNKTSIKLENKQANQTPIVAGIARRNEENPKIKFDKTSKFLAYWEPNINESGHTGIAIILPQSNIDFIDNDKKQFLLKTMISNKKPFTYYNGGAWNKAGKITTADDWQRYVANYAEALEHPLQVKLK